jgi:hypothetical protein
MVARSEGGMVDGGRKRMAMARSEGGGVEVNGGSKRMVTVFSVGGGVEVGGLRMRTVSARSEARDEAAVCSRARIKDGRRR